MKKILTTILSVIFVSALSFAQTQEGDIQIIQQYFGMQKLVLVQQYMKFDKAQDSVFWPIYNAYEMERKALGKQKMQMIQDYVKVINNMDENKATELVDRSMRNEIGFKELQKKYFPKMTKAVGPVKAAQFYQLENYLNNIINLTIQENIPFVGELEQKHDKVKK